MDIACLYIKEPITTATDNNWEKEPRIRPAQVQSFIFQIKMGI